MMVLTRWRVAADDLGHARSLALESMPGVSPSSCAAWLIAPTGIADLVRDAGGEAAQRRELGLLDPRGQRAGVLEEDQHRRGLGGSERREVRLDAARPVGGGEGARGCLRPGRGSALRAPGGQQVQQARGHLAQQRPGHRARRRRASRRPIR